MVEVGAQEEVLQHLAGGHRDQEGLVPVGDLLGVGGFADLGEGDEGQEVGFENGLQLGNGVGEVFPVHGEEPQFVRAPLLIADGLVQILPVQIHFVHGHDQGAGSGVGRGAGGRGHQIDIDVNLGGGARPDHLVDQSPLSGQAVDQSPGQHVLFVPLQAARGTGQAGHLDRLAAQLAGEGLAAGFREQGILVEQHLAGGIDQVDPLELFAALEILEGGRQYWRIGGPDGVEILECLPEIGPGAAELDHVVVEALHFPLQTLVRLDGQDLGPVEGIMQAEQQQKGQRKHQGQQEQSRHLDPDGQPGGDRPPIGLSEQQGPDGEEDQAGDHPVLRAGFQGEPVPADRKRREQAHHRRFRQGDDDENPVAIHRGRLEGEAILGEHPFGDLFQPGIRNLEGVGVVQIGEPVGKFRVGRLVGSQNVGKAKRLGQGPPGDDGHEAAFGIALVVHEVPIEDAWLARVFAGDQGARRKDRPLDGEVLAQDGLKSLEDGGHLLQEGIRAIGGPQGRPVGKLGMPLSQKGDQAVGGRDGDPLQRGHPVLVPHDDRGTGRQFLEGLLEQGFVLGRGLEMALVGFAEGMENLPQDPFVGDVRSQGGQLAGIILDHPVPGIGSLARRIDAVALVEASQGDGEKQQENGQPAGSSPGGSPGRLGSDGSGGT